MYLYYFGNVNISNTHVSTDLEWRLQDKIKVRGSKDLCVGSFYRPPNNTEAEYLGILESYLARIPTYNGAHLISQV